jgi:hypothetical protein
MESEDKVPGIASPPNHVSLTPPPEPVPDQKGQEDRAREDFFRGAASEQEVAHADAEAAAKRLTPPKTFGEALWGFMKALGGFFMFMITVAMQILSVLLMIAAWGFLVGLLFLPLIISPHGKRILGEQVHTFFKDLTDWLDGFFSVMIPYHLQPPTDAHKKDPGETGKKFSWNVNLCAYSLQSRRYVPVFSDPKNWTAKENFSRYVEVPVVSARELASWSVKGVPLETIVFEMLAANTTAKEALFGLPHEQSTMLCMHQFHHPELDFERRICVLTRDNHFHVLVNPELHGYAEEAHAFIVKERSRACHEPFLKSRRPVLDVRFIIDAPATEDERHRPMAIRTIMDDPAESLAFQMRWEEMQGGAYECK